MEEKVRCERNSSLLIVEDDESQLRTLTAIMQGEGFGVIGCSTASEAIEHLKHLETGVVVLDLRLLGLSGTQLLERLADATDKIRVIINTAYSSYESAKDALNLGAFAYVEKAGDPDELIRYVHRAFQASLRSYADELETVVAERTQEMRQANELLREEINERRKAEEALRRERDKAQRYLDVAGVMLVAIDSEQRVGLINKKGCEILGYKEEEILAKKWFDNFLPERIREEVRAVFEKVIQSDADAPEYYENPALTKSGDERLVAWRNTFLRNEKGKIIATLSSGEDITERRKTEEALQASEQRYRDLFENAGEGIITLDMNGRITEANRLVEEYGFNRAELLGRKLFDFVPEYDKARSVSDFQALIAGKRLLGQMDVITPKGIITVEYRDTPIEWAGEVIGVQIILTDITERKQAEEELKRFQFIVESAHDAIFFKDLKSRYIVVNNKTLESFGLSHKEVIGKNDLEIMSDKQEARINIENDQLVFKTGKPTKFSKHMTGADGKEYWFEAVKVPQYDNNGNIIGLIGIDRDITERKKMEEELRESEEKFKSIFEHANDGIIYLDSSGNILDINEKAAQMFGGLKQQAVNKHFTEVGVFPADEIPTFMSNFEKIFAGEEVVLTVPIKNKKGQEIILECSASVAQTDDGGGRIMVIARDITERKKAEEVIAKLAKFPDEDPYPVLRISGPGMVIYANTASFPLLKVWRCRVGQSLPDPWHELVLDALSSGQSQQTEAQCDNRIFSLIFAPVVDVNYVNVYGLDITERKRAEKGLRSSRDYLKKLTDSMWDVVFSVKMPERIIEWINDSFRLIGYEPEECIGKTTEFLYSDESEFLDFGNKLKGAIAVEKDVLHAEQILRRKNGETFPAEITTTFFREKGEIVRVTSIVRDVSERKKVEDKLIEYQAKLKAMASKILMTEERERQRLAMGLHDEVCQKLVLTKLALESSLNLVSDSKVLASLRIVCEGIGETIEQADSLTFELSNPVLRQLGFVIALEKYLTEEIQQKHGIEYELEGDEQLGTLSDEIKNCLFRVTRELLTNVVKHAHARKVKVSARESQSQIYVRVQDDGVGFKESQARSKVSKTARFGLFSIREQLEYLGGHLEIESEPGRGTKATVTVPLTKKAIIYMPRRYE